MLTSAFPVLRFSGVTLTLTHRFARRIFACALATDVTATGRNALPGRELFKWFFHLAFAAYLHETIL